MLRYIIKRFLTIIPVLIGVSMLVFGLIRLIPGDPAIVMLGERATEESIARVRTQLGLDKPIYEQYFIYMSRVVRGDLGTSVLRQEPVTQEIVRRFPATIELALGAILVALIVGIPAGLISAIRRGTWFDSASMLVALTGVSMPIFWLGLMLTLLFAVVLHWFPTGGRLDAQTGFDPITNLLVLDGLLRGNVGVSIQAMRHLFLPAIALGTIPGAIIARMTRSAMLEVLGQDYIRTAHAKGLHERVVVTRHALRNALLPVITVIGLQVGLLLSGAILTETIFSWPGIGRWIVEAIYARDYPIVQGVTLFIATIFVVVNLTVDVLYAFVDPRIRFD
ncbi:MAG: peptide ABC transporter permease [Chloroflexi bacterium RBG_16_57_9]|nr:MAG: peptide ABC transporter permease [Chloroflexi bacterium RBG_16_57_9]